MGMSGTLRPSNSYYPNMTETYEWLTLDPLAPESVMQEKRFAGNSFCNPPKVVYTISEVDLLMAFLYSASRCSSAYLSLMSLCYNANKAL